MSEIRCAAPHPGRDRLPERFGGKEHGALLPALLPYGATFVGLVSSLAEIETGNVGVVCMSRDCRAVHEYALSAVLDPR